MNILIPARGGSKRIPNKNIIEVAGKPLICYSIEQALRITPNVYVSTDCDKIGEVARSAGAHIISRPSRYATDSSDVRDTIRHFLEAVETDIFVLMQPTSPLLTEKYIKEGLQKIENSDSVISVCEVREFFWGADRRPLNYELGKKPRTQDMAPYYKENGAFYITRAQAFQNTHDLTNGKVDFVIMPEDESVDIDTYFDLKYCKLLLQWREENDEI